MPLTPDNKDGSGPSEPREPSAAEGGAETAREPKASQAGAQEPREPDQPPVDDATASPPPTKTDDKATPAPGTSATQQVAVKTNPLADEHRNEGDSAYHNGQPIDANPYYKQIQPGMEIPQDHPARCWAVGWNRARRKAEPDRPDINPSEALAQMDTSVSDEAANILGDSRNATPERINQVYARIARRRHVHLSEASRLEGVMDQLRRIADAKADPLAEDVRVSGTGDVSRILGYES